MNNILYITSVNNPFTETDRLILEQRYHVESYLINRKSYTNIFKMWQAARRADAIVAWFASWHSLPSFLAGAIHNKPRLLLTAGYDLANAPEINYGLRRGGLPKLISSLTFQLTTTAIPTSDFSRQEALRNTPLKNEQIKVAYLGVPDNPAFQEQTPKSPIAFTVGDVDRVTAYRKGIQPFVEAAKFLPDIPFIVVGKPRDDYIHHLQTIATNNVEFTGFMPDSELLSLRQKARVYVQVSQHEGFGLAVAEAMLARCIPVVSNEGALPEVVGESGVFTKDTTPEEIAHAIRVGLESPNEVGESARKRVLHNFSMATRTQIIHDTLEELLSR